MPAFTDFAVANAEPAGVVSAATVVEPESVAAVTSADRRCIGDERYLIRRFNARHLQPGQRTNAIGRTHPKNSQARIDRNRNDLIDPHIARSIDGAGGRIQRNSNADALP